MYYLEKDSQPQPAQEEQKQTKNAKYIEFTTGHLEDALTKIIKLLANLATEESVALSVFQAMKDLLTKFVTMACEAVNRRNIE